MRSEIIFSYKLDESGKKDIETRYKNVRTYRENFQNIKRKYKRKGKEAKAHPKWERKRINNLYNFKSFSLCICARYRHVVSVEKIQ